MNEGISDWFMRGNARKLLKMLKQEGFKITSDAIMNEFRAKKGKLIVDIFGGGLDMVFINFPDETGVGPNGTRTIGNFSKKSEEEIQELFDLIHDYSVGAYGYSPNSAQYKVKQQARQAMNRSYEFDIEDDELNENTMKKSELKDLIKETVEEVKKMENPCWKGYKAYGTKQKDGREVPNCVPVEENANECDESETTSDDIKNQLKEAIKGMVREIFEEDLNEGGTADKKGHKSKAGGLTQKGRDAYNRKTGSNLKAPVTKSHPTGKDASRRKSFCARMSGVKGPMKKPNGKPTRKALALRRWKCRSSE